MTQRKVLVLTTPQSFDELDATDIPALAYDASGAAATAASGAASALSTHAGAADPHTVYALESALGTLATQSGTFSGTSSGTNTGDQTIPVGGTPALTLGTANTAGTSPNFLRRDDTILAFDGTVAAAVGTAATGAATVAARRDHVHPTGAGTPSTQAFGDAAATGTGPAAAMTDHKHAMPVTGPVGSAGLPTGALAESYARWNTAVNQTAVLLSARLNLHAILLQKGQVISTITFVAGSTALSVGSNQWFALFDISRGKLRVTNDDTSTAWAANATKTLTLATTYTVPTTGMYYVGIMVKATTVPTLSGLGAIGTALGQIAPFMGGDADTGLTDPASCPSTAAALSNPTTTKQPYFYVS